MSHAVYSHKLERLADCGDLLLVAHDHEAQHRTYVSVSLRSRILTLEDKVLPTPPSLKQKGSTQ